MRPRSFRILAGIALLPVVAGCSRVEGMAARYRAERMTWEAQHEETRLRLGKAAPDSTTFLKIRAAYQKLRLTFRPPFLPGSGKEVEQLRRDIARQVGGAELTASRNALLAHRPDLALESARWVSSIADDDTSLHREADLGVILAQRGMHHYDEAIATMRAMLDRYPPIAPPSPAQEDQILSIPGAIVELRAEMGDSAGVRKDQAYAVTYYRRILASRPPPFLESQVRARLSRTLLEMGDANAAFAEVGALRRLVLATPALKPLEPELLYSEGRIRAMQKNYDEALDLYDLVLMVRPASPFAGRALLDAAIICERLHDRNGALARYHALVERPDDPEVSPIANFRMAMVEDQMGNWADAKQTLEGIPLKYPESQAAAEAPLAIVDHYNRAREADGAKSALLKAIDTFHGLIARDTTSANGALYRWSILRAHAALGQWKDVLGMVDQMAAKDQRSPLAAEALFQGAQMARAHGDKARSDKYLQVLIAKYPNSARAATVRKLLGQGAGAAARPGARGR